MVRDTSAYSSIQAAVPRPSLQILRIERLQILRQENSVFADQLAVEPHLAAAPVFALDKHHVPVYGAAIAVVALLIRLPGREVQRAGDFFVEQNVAHRTQDGGIE